MYSVCDCVCIDNDIFVSLCVYAWLLNEHVVCVLHIVSGAKEDLHCTVYCIW